MADNEKVLQMTLSIKRLEIRSVLFLGRYERIERGYLEGLVLSVPLM